jgi:hypothetical protein
MSVMRIVCRINEVIADTQNPRQTKTEILQNLALTCWQDVIPEYGTETFKNLKSDEIQKCWSVVRDEIEKYKTGFCMFLTGQPLVVISTG